MNLDKEVFELSMDDILPNRFQPREVFDQQALNELALSIREHGVIQPIIVRKIGDKYEIVAGERRFRASQIAGKTTIPALVRNIDDRESAKVALLENLQRKNLTSIEEARTYDTILKLDNLTQEELANNLGKSQSAVANKLRLLNLDMSVQDALLNGKISERHARSLLNISDHNKQKQLLDKIILNRMTVKQLDDEIANITGKKVINDDEEVIINSQTNPPIANNLVNKLDDSNVDSINDINYIDSTKINNSDITPPTFSEQQNQSTATEINNQVFFENPEPVNDNLTIDQILANYNSIFKNKNNISNSNLSDSNINIENISEDNKVNNNEQVENIISNSLSQVSTSPIVDIPLKPEVDQTNQNYSEPVNNSPVSQNYSEPVKNQIFNQNINSSVYGINQNEVYDLRFAINNFRQAVQNTEKFGFKINVEEFDFDNVYQIVIKIDKTK